MYKNKANDGSNNACGKQLRKLRLAMNPRVSQNAFAKRLHELGLFIDKNAVQRIESGERFVTDIEIKILAKALGVTYSELLDAEDEI